MLAIRPSLTAARGGKILAFIAFFILPIVATVFGATIHVEHSKSTQFCLSCHSMEPYGKSLDVDDPSYVPASHFQNNRIPRDHACFTCHTDYTMFGDLHAKIRGLRHLYVYYFKEIPKKLALYEPYKNRECLHCHAAARSFEEKRSCGDFIRRIRLPESVDRDKIKAEFKDGVLRVVVPKIKKRGEES